VLTFPATEFHHSSASTTLYCLVTEAYVCERLAQSYYMTANWLGIEPTLTTIHEATHCGGVAAWFRLILIEK